MSIMENWHEEKRSAWLYRIIAEREIDLTRKTMFAELADNAEKQAALWEKKWHDTFPDANMPKFRPELRAHIVAHLVKIFGTNQLRFILSAMKVRGMSVYAGVPYSHPAATHLEKRHRGVGNAGNLRAAVFGINDGMVSNVSLLAGLAGSGASHHTLLIAGLAGLLAGACSMASGEYVSVRSQREFFEYQISLEQEELKLYPEEEASELACIYRARGMPADAAQKMADLVISNPDSALDVLAREELGLDPNDMASPSGAAFFSFVAFALGALLPLLPFLLTTNNSLGLYSSLGVTAIALTGIGATLSLFTSRSALYSGLRMLLIGALAATVTFWAGHWLGGII